MSGRRRKRDEIQRRKIERSPRNDKNDVFLRDDLGREGRMTGSMRILKQNGTKRREGEREETRYKRSANGGY